VHAIQNFLALAQINCIFFIEKLQKMRNQSDLDTGLFLIFLSFLTFFTNIQIPEDPAFSTGGRPFFSGKLK
jgi:hypothetical protein